MKVVLFCGGLGLRVRDYSQNVPKPMLPIGSRPILWHVMRYYAHYGHKDFILCLGYRAECIKDYFLNYNEAAANDCVVKINGSGHSIELLANDMHDWRITLVDTGYSANIGGRLKAVEKYVRDEEMFLANYSDNLTDFPLPTLIDKVKDTGKVAGFLAVKPALSYHLVSFGQGNVVTALNEIRETDIWINGGNFVLRPRIFDYMEDGDELVDAPFARLIEGGELLGCQYEGFWSPLDTFKDKQRLDDLYEKDKAPWQIWKSATGNGILAKGNGHDLL
jgi:glucose-1-phosphate cytidylyltransferase